MGMKCENEPSVMIKLRDIQRGKTRSTRERKSDRLSSVGVISNGY